MSEEPIYDLFSANDAGSSRHVVILAAFVGQLFAVVFSIGIIFWISWIMAFAFGVAVSLYLFRLAWDRSIKFQSLAWKLTLVLVTVFNVSFLAVCLYFIKA